MSGLDSWEDDPAAQEDGNLQRQTQNLNISSSTMVIISNSMDMDNSQVMRAIHNIDNKTSASTTSRKDSSNLAYTTRIMEGNLQRTIKALAPSKHSRNSHGRRPSVSPRDQRAIHNLRLRLRLHP
jgi:hypothetical protein